VSARLPAGVRVKRVRARAAAAVVSDVPAVLGSPVTPTLSVPTRPVLGFPVRLAVSRAPSLP
jgi:hypothetical protein